MAGSRSMRTTALFLTALIALQHTALAEPLRSKPQLLHASSWPSKAEQTYTVSGCICQEEWSYEGHTYRGCAQTVGVQYSWCKTSNKPMPCLGTGRSTHWDRCERSTPPKVAVTAVEKRLGHADEKHEQDADGVRRRPPKKMTQQSGSLQPWFSEAPSRGCPCAVGKGYCRDDAPDVCRCLDRKRYAGVRCDLCQEGFTLVNDECVPGSPFAGIDGLMYGVIISVAVLFGCGVCYYRRLGWKSSMSLMRDRKRVNLLAEFDIELNGSDIKQKSSPIGSRVGQVPEESEPMLIDLDEAVMDYVQIDSDALLDSLNEDGDLELVDGDDVP